MIEQTKSSGSAGGQSRARQNSSSPWAHFRSLSGLFLGTCLALAPGQSDAAVDDWQQSWSMAAGIADQTLSISSEATEVLKALAQAEYNFFNRLALNGNNSQLLQQYAASRRQEWGGLAARLNNKVAPGLKAAETALFLAQPVMEQTFIALKLQEDLQKLKSDPALASIVRQMSDDALRNYFDGIAKELATKVGSKLLRETTKVFVLKVVGRTVSKFAGHTLGVVAGVLLDPEIAGPVIETNMPDAVKNPSAAATWLVDVGDYTHEIESSCAGSSACIESGAIRGGVSVSPWQFFALKYAWSSKVGSALSSRYAWVKRYDPIYSSAGDIIGLGPHVPVVIDDYLNLAPSPVVVGQPLEATLHVHRAGRVRFVQRCASGASAFLGSPAKVVGSVYSWKAALSTSATVAGTNGGACSLSIEAIGPFDELVARTISFSVQSATPAASAVALSGTVTSPAKLTVAEGTNVTISGQSTGATRIDIEFTAVGTTQSEIRSTAPTGSVSAQSWGLSRVFPVAGNYVARAIAVGSNTSLVVGTVAVTVSPATPSQPVAPRVDRASMVTETLLDGTVVQGGATLSKSWTLRNDGTTAWGTGYCLHPASGAALGTTPDCVVGAVLPGASYRFEVPLKAPLATGADTSYKQDWALTNGSGDFFRPWVQVVVKAVATPLSDRAVFVSETIPDGTVVGSGSPFNKSWTFRNDGSTTWGAGYCLRPVSGTSLSVTPACVGQAVLPGGTWRFDLPMQAPAALASDAIYRQDWSLTNGATGLSKVWVQIIVKGTATPLVLPTLQVRAEPVSVVLGGTMVFKGVVDATLAVAKADLVFPDAAGLTEPMTAAGAGVWQRSRVMSGTGINRPFMVRMLLADGRTVQQSGAFSVDTASTTPAPALVQLALSQGAYSWDGKSALQMQAKSSIALNNVSVRIRRANTALILIGEGMARASADGLLWSSAATLTTRLANQPDGSYTVEVFGFKPDAQQVVSQAVPLTIQRAATAPVAPASLSVIFTAGSNVQAGMAWPARLNTSLPIFGAEVLFTNGKRIPLAGADTLWEAPPENSKFADATNYSYEVRVFRSSTSNAEVMHRGALTVNPAPIVANTPRITSSLQVSQGMPYNLSVATALQADRVSVKWADVASEQGLTATNVERTQWAFGNRLFASAGPVGLTLRTWKDGVTQPTGEITASIIVIAPTTTNLRLIEISKNIIQGESPYFTVAAGLAANGVTVQLGGALPVSLALTSTNGQEKNFRGQVKTTAAGALTYTIRALDANGQILSGALTGSVPVAAVGDALTVKNPVPLEIAKGSPVEWQFLTAKNPDQMWMEFSAPIGNINLTGAFFRHTFNHAAGSYTYRLMRKDYLGNIFPINGAAGTIIIKDVVFTAAFTALQARVLGSGAKLQTISNGATLTFAPTDQIEFLVRASQQVPLMIVRVNEKNFDRGMGAIGGDRTNWSGAVAGLTVGAYTITIYASDGVNKLSQPVPISARLEVK